MTGECHSLLQGLIMRATKVDDCGAPLSGDCNQFVTDGFIQVSMTDQIESPDEFKQKIANGTFRVNQRSRSQLNWIENKIQLVDVMPELINFLTGLPIVYDDSLTPVAVGFQTDSADYATGNFALELWTGIARTRGQTACTDGTQYGYMVEPWLYDGVMSGDVVIQNGLATFEITAITSDGNDWGTGPYDVVEDVNGDPSPLLEALESTVHRHLQFTTLAPPAASCSCMSLTVPS